METGATWRFVGGFTKRADPQPGWSRRPDRAPRWLLLRSDTVGGRQHIPRARRFLGAVLGWAGALVGLGACAAPPPATTDHTAGALQQAPDGNLVVTAPQLVVNRYGRLGAAASRGDKQLTLGSAKDFADLSLQPGDLLMLLQPQGAQLQTADTDQYGALAALRGAGLFELVAVAAVDGTTSRVMLDTACGGLRNDYDPRTQVIRVPQYGSLTVNAGASVVALPWDGQVGGVVAVRAQQALTVHGEIDASGQGFRGGPAQQPGQLAADESPDVAGYVTAAPTSGGAKGESVAGFTAEYQVPGGQGRGAPANGGGGGNAFKAGGGGGGGAGLLAGWSGQGVMSAGVTGATAWTLDPAYKANNNQLTSSSGGGRGGYSASTTNLSPLTVPPGDPSWQGNLRRERGGRGGRPMSSDPGARLFFGGGGGAGDQNGLGAQLTQGGGGGAGGGLVYVLAGTVQGDGRIAASGAPGGDTASGSGAAQGAGGGGGGGAIIVNSDSLQGTLRVEALGGDGGRHQSAGAGISDANGPGGGGGGGFLAVPAATASSVVRAVRGGSGGTTASGAMVGFPSNGATSGGAGLEQPLSLAAAAPLCLPADLSVTVLAETATITAGSNLTFTVVVTNHGPSDVTAAHLQAALTPAMTSVAWTCLSSDSSLDPLNCADPAAARLGDINKTLVVPALATVTFTVYIFLDRSAAGTLTYKASVSAPPSLQDLVPANNSASATTQVTEPADVQVQLLAAPNPSLSGEAITLTATVRNAGPSPARGLQLALQLPVGAQLHRPPSGPGWTCTAVAPDGTLTCTNPALADGTVSEVFLALLPDFSAQTLAASAAATATNLDPDPANNTAAVTVPIVFDGASYRTPAIGGGGFGCQLGGAAPRTAPAAVASLSFLVALLGGRLVRRRRRRYPSPAGSLGR